MADENQDGDYTIPAEPATPTWAANGLAKEEEKNWDDEDKLKGQKAQNTLQWLKVYGVIVVALTVLFSIIFISGMVIWAWHYLAPDCWGWLTSEQLSKVQSVIFSGSLGGIVSFIAQRHLSQV
nr:hypothetical protein [uncultured Cohaesibacter sp.]